MSIAMKNGHLFVSADDVEVDDNGHGATIRRYIGGKGDMSLGPKAFLDQVVEGREEESHFHPIDQYQILFGAPGAYYQRTPVPGVLLHYTDAYSVYGPFGSRDEGRLEFLTLRAKPSALRGSMPQFRDQLLYRGSRHHVINVDPFLEGTLEEGVVTIETLIAAEPDGLAAYVARGGSNATIAPPPGDLGTGRYTVVLDGSVSFDGTSYPKRSIAWSSGDASELVFTGGADGAALLFLHMPYPDTPSVRLAAS